MRIVRYFNQSAGLLLLATGMVLLLSNWASMELVQARDPLLLVSIRTVHWVLAVLGLVLAALCLFRERLSAPLAGVAWLAVNFWIYVIGLRFDGVENSRALLGSFPEAFGLSRDAASVLVHMVFGYLLLGGLCSLGWYWKIGRHQELADLTENLKMSCAHCGGHIAFPSRRENEKISCPHCQKQLMLHRQEKLKMSCFFCKGHIEFPSNALGTKMPCPHCKMDITLLELK